jgi:hypothetical protein
LINTEATEISITELPSVTGGIIVAPNAELNIGRSDSSLVSTEIIPSGKSEAYNVVDSVVSNSDDSYTANVKAASTYELPDVNISNSDDTFNVNIPSVKNYELPNVEHTDTDGSPVILPGMTPMVCSVPSEPEVEVNGELEGSFDPSIILSVVIDDGTNPVTPDNVDLTGNLLTISVPAAINPRSTAKLIRNGQTTSFRTGDGVGRGRLTSYSVLAENNPFGNTNRFTDELGGQTYTKNIVIDWSTYNDPYGNEVLGYYRIVSGSNTNWNGAIDGAAAHTVIGFPSGWGLWNKLECQNILSEGVTSSTYLNHPPFNITADVNIWCCDTAGLTTANARALASTGSGNISQVAKTTVFGRWVAVRVFTVTGTTLT